MMPFPQNTSVRSLWPLSPSSPHAQSPQYPVGHVPPTPKPYCSQHSLVWCPKWATEPASQLVPYEFILGQRSRHRIKVCAYRWTGAPGDPSRQITCSATLYMREGSSLHPFCTELAGTQSSVTSPLKTKSVCTDPPGKRLGDGGLQ